MSKKIYQKLRHSHEFKNVYIKGQRSVTKNFILQSAKPKNLINVNNKIRLGFIVTKRIGNAVVRNRIRRRLKIVALEVIIKKGLPNRDYVLIGKKDSYNCPYNELLQNVNYALKSINCLK
ncbi:ribonuclease P protein component [Alphaproteobacteria bacterium]|nr:ribonuclease P protein component [Alphaproteobacteria bacterium]